MASVRLVPPVFSRNPRHWLRGKVIVLPCGGASGELFGAVEVPVGQAWAQQVWWAGELLHVSLLASSERPHRLLLGGHCLS